MKTMAETNGAVTARFIAATGKRLYPKETMEAAKMCLVDWFAVALGASREPAAVAVRSLARKWAAPGGARLLLGGTTTPAVAALVNGTTAHCLDYDDTHVGALAHLSGPTWAAVLALASDAGLSGAEALAAFITGFEVGGKIGGEGLGQAVTEIGFHATGVIGRLSATAAACVLLRMDEEHVAHAIGLAATQASGLTASFGTMAKPFHAGKAGMDGVLSAQLSAEGFEAATDLLDVEHGLAGTMVQDGSVRIGPLQFSQGQALSHNAFKPYACCMLIHSSIDAGRSLLGELHDAKVERVQLTVDPLVVKRAGKTSPQTSLEGKFSLAYCVALALSGYLAVPTDFAAERLNDPEVRALLERVEVKTASWDNPLQAVLDVDLSDGRQLHAEVPYPLGNPENPMSWADMEHKFMALVGPQLGVQAGTLFQALRRFEEPGKFSEVMRLVAREED